MTTGKDGKRVKSPHQFNSSPQGEGAALSVSNGKRLMHPNGPVTSPRAQLFPCREARILEGL